jgi:GxxExxY protein
MRHFELRKSGFKAEAERPISVHMMDKSLVHLRQIVGKQFVVELKASQSLAKAHEVQLVNYLVATGIEEGFRTSGQAAGV